jgi:hypothetical protein
MTAMRMTAVRPLVVGMVVVVVVVVVGMFDMKMVAWLASQATDSSSNGEAGSIVSRSGSPAVAIQMAVSAERIE